MAHFDPRVRGGTRLHRDGNGEVYLKSVRPLESSWPPFGPTRAEAGVRDKGLATPGASPSISDDRPRYPGAGANRPLTSLRINSSTLHSVRVFVRTY